MSNKESEALIIKNLAMLEDVMTVHYNKTGPNLCEKISELINEWSNDQNFDIEFDLWDDDTVSFAPKEWKYTNERGKIASKATYKLVFVKENEEIEFSDCDSFIFISPFFGVGPVRSGFSFYIDYKAINIRKMSDFKYFLQNHSTYNEISNAGFILLADGSWFISWKLDAEKMADEYMNDSIQDALKPISVKLDIIGKAHPVFAALLADAENNFRQI